MITHADYHAYTLHVFIIILNKNWKDQSVNRSLSEFINIFFFFKKMQEKY